MAPAPDVIEDLPSRSDGCRAATNHRAAVETPCQGLAAKVDLHDPTVHSTRFPFFAKPGALGASLALGDLSRTTGAVLRASPGL